MSSFFTGNAAYKQTVQMTHNPTDLFKIMNDLAFQVKYRVEASGGLNYFEPMALNQALNRIPLKAIDYQYSIDALKAKLAQIIT